MHIRRGTTHTLVFFNFGHNKLKYLKKTNKIISLHPCVRPSFFQLLITNQNQTGKVTFFDNVQSIIIYQATFIFKSLKNQLMYTVAKFTFLSKRTFLFRFFLGPKIFTYNSILMYFSQNLEI